MNEPVLDSSAVLAVMLREPGEQYVRSRLPGALLSSVNLAEVVARLGERGLSGEETHRNVSSLGIIVVPFDDNQAVLCGDLRKSTRAVGLSLGDRACLALARLRGATAVTADRAWRRLAGFDIELIRDGRQPERP